MKRISAFALVALVLPIPLSAQQPPAVNPVTLSFRAFSAHYQIVLVAALDSIPASKYGYKPSPAQHTIGHIAQHLENSNYRLCAYLTDRSPPSEARDSLIADTVKAMWPKDTLIKRLIASFVFCNTAIGVLNDTRLSELVAAPPPAPTGRSPRIRYLLAFVTELAERYSQVATYMQLNGMDPPSGLSATTRAHLSGAH